MNPQDLPKNQSAEMASLDGKKPQNPAGVYRHEAAGKEIIILPDPSTTAQQDAVVRLGFVWVGPPPTQLELRAMQQAQLKQDLEDEKNGVLPEIYAVPGTQEQVFNGTVTDTSGPGEALAAKDAEIARLQTLLDQAAAPAAPAVDPAPAPEVPAAPAPEVPAPTETAPVGEVESATEDAAEAPDETQTNQTEGN